MDTTVLKQAYVKEMSSQAAGLPSRPGIIFANELAKQYDALTTVAMMSEPGDPAGMMTDSDGAGED